MQELHILNFRIHSYTNTYVKQDSLDACENRKTRTLAEFYVYSYLYIYSRSDYQQGIHEGGLWVAIRAVDIHCQIKGWFGSGRNAVKYKMFSPGRTYVGV